MARRMDWAKARKFPNGREAIGKPQRELETWGSFGPMSPLRVIYRRPDPEPALSLFKAGAIREQLGRRP